MGALMRRWWEATEGIRFVAVAFIAVAVWAAYLVWATCTH
jgi:predicted negative regulator of RcsB-dependent stress response